MQRLIWSGTGAAELVQRAIELLDGAAPRRTILGIAGAPASGKSTLNDLLLAELHRLRPGQVAGVGMDAFHIGHRILQQRGQVGIKGAPETFDALGYINLLRRLRTEPGTVYAPEFRREIEDSLAHVVEIGPEVRLVVTEGNYLLLPQAPWDGVRELLDEAWFVRLDDTERRRRMVARHQSFGHSRADAEERAMGSDERNAQLVDAAQNHPDLWIEHEAVSAGQ